MAKSAGVISIRLDAGTGQFIADLERAKGKVIDFGAHVKQAGDHTVSGIQAISGGLRVLDGNGGIRAAERFLATTLGLGGAFKALFPIIGSLALADIFIKAGENAYKFFKTIQDAPAKIANAFRELNGPLQAANDELKLSNDRLANDIAKLEGKRENTLKVALDEARVSADKLADSLDKDLQNLEKLQKENNLGFFKSLISDQRSTNGDEEGTQRFRNQVGDVLAASNERIRAAKNEGDVTAAETERTTKLQKIYNEEISRRSVLLKEAQKLQDFHEGKNQASTYQEYVHNPDKFAPFGIQAKTPDQSQFINQQKGDIANLQSELDRISLTSDNSKLQRHKSDLEIDKRNSGEEEKALKEGYDRMLDDMESFEKLMASERLDFRENELREISQYGNKYKNLRHELQNEIGRLSQASFAEAKEARDKDEKDEQHYLQELATMRTEWAKRTDQAITDSIKRNAERKPTEPRPDIPQSVIEGNAKTRLEGTPIGNRIAAAEAGYATTQAQQEAIENEKRLLSVMEQGGYTLGQILTVRDKILQMQIALRAEQKGEVEQQQILRDTINESLSVGKLSDGWRAFWLEMQTQAEKPGRILYDGLNNAVNRLSDSLSNLLTGGKGNFGKALQDVGRQISGDAIRSEIHKALGSIGNRLGINIGGAQKHDGQTAPGAIWVQIAGPGGTSSANSTNSSGGGINLGGIGAKLGGIFTGHQGGGIFNLLGSGKSGGILSDIGSTLARSLFGGYRAAGGPVRAGAGYVVGENGPEYFSPGSDGSITPNSRMGGIHYHVSVDARGADEESVYQRVSRGILAAHNSAVGTSIQANVERQKRTPSG